MAATGPGRRSRVWYAAAGAVVIAFGLWSRSDAAGLPWPVAKYAVDGQKAVAAGCPADVAAFAEGMLAEVRWRPDPVFMADVCEADGRLWLVELNGFSCSWLYACDPPAVFAAAGELMKRA